MVSIEEATKIAERYGLDLNESKKYKAELYYISKCGNKSKIKPEEFTDDMKSIIFMMSHGFIIADKIVGKILTEGVVIK